MYVCRSFRVLLSPRRLLGLSVVFSTYDLPPFSSHKSEIPLRLLQSEREVSEKLRETMNSVITGNFRPAFFPSQLSKNSARFLFRPFTTLVFTRSLTTKVRAFVETKPTVCNSKTLKKGVNFDAKVICLVAYSITLLFDRHRLRWRKRRAAAAAVV